jgi:serine/threonine protein kinase
LAELVFYRAGAFKETYRGRSAATGEIVAVKILPTDASGAADVRLAREIAALRSFSSAVFPRLLVAEKFTARDGTVMEVVIEEFLHGGSLGDRLARGPLPHNQVVHLASRLIAALGLLAGRRLVHRDIKPENIMFRSDDQEPVLVDFGLVRDLSQPSVTMTWLPNGPGTPFFAAPEQLNNDKHLIDWRTDQFSLGVVLSIAASGLHPYQLQGENPLSIVWQVASRKPIPVECRQRLTALKLAFIETMVRAWPVHRYTRVEALLEAVSEPHERLSATRT